MARIGRFVFPYKKVQSRSRIGSVDQALPKISGGSEKLVPQSYAANYDGGVRGASGVSMKDGMYFCEALSAYIGRNKRQNVPTQQGQKRFVYQVLILVDLKTMFLSSRREVSRKESGRRLRSDIRSSRSRFMA